ncbi:MAG: hypothetical protein IT291_10020 [Deltaproteobacteria bacterium]|nr:hypothetical protein [Deltaproteobacteria bacterium]
MNIDDFENAMEEEIEDQFIAVAMEISHLFPKLDLRFNLQSGSSKVRYSAPSISAEIFELDLNLGETSALIIEACFKIKEIGRLFDA